jgi:23S rRNA (guanine1835-N2)-methyltransferase
MPELPEVESLARFLAEHLAGRTVERVHPLAVSALKTYDPPPDALAGRVFAGATRHGKFLDLDADGLHLVIHLARAGWLRWKEGLPELPPKPGKGPLALRVRLAGPDGPGFDVTEAGTRKRLAVYLVGDPQQVPGIQRLGPDPLAPDFTLGAVRLLSTQDEPPARIDVLLVRVPKSLALLEDQLHRLAPAVHAGTVVIGTGMTTEIHTSTLKLFERIIGPTRTSLAVRKARLIHCTPDPALKPGPSPWPHSYELPGDVAGGLSVTNHAGVFSAERLDIGTRLLLQHLPQLSGPTRAVDLGCGNGVVGTAVAALAGPGTEAEVVFADESHQAIASAQATFAANGPHPDALAEFLIGDGLSGLPPGSVDLVLNNPPFHSHQATTDAIARRMFAGARAALRPGGELRVVGNRHLGYHVMLRRLFGNCTTVASNPKFVVLSAI